MPRDLAASASGASLRIGDAGIRTARSESAKVRSVFVVVTVQKFANGMPSWQPIDKDRVASPPHQLGVMLIEIRLPVMARRLDVGIHALQRRDADDEVARVRIGHLHRIHSVSVWKVVIRDAVETRLGGAEVP